MSVPIKALVMAITGLASPAAEAQLLGLGFESNISLTQQDLDMIRQTVNQQIHGKPVGATASWSNPSSQNSGTIRLLKKFTARNMHCEEIGYILTTTAMAVSPEHYTLDSCLQPDGSWKIL
jgi:surface antigen